MILGCDLACKVIMAKGKTGDSGKELRLPVDKTRQPE